MYFNKAFLVRLSAARYHFNYKHVGHTVADMREGYPNICLDKVLGFLAKKIILKEKEKYKTVNQ